MLELTLRELAKWGDVSAIAGSDIRPVVLVHLNAGPCDASDVSTAKAVVTRSNAVIVGVAPSGIDSALEEFVEGLAFTIAPGSECRATVDGDLDSVVRATQANPVAACTAASLLKLTDRLDVEDGLVVESLAYSTLLAGGEFRRWRGGRPMKDELRTGQPPVRLERAANGLTITLHDPARRNAFSAAMRDGLLAGLDVVNADADVAEVLLQGAGVAFCSGGDLDEFGLATDVALAHQIRLDASAGLAVHRQRTRVRAMLHGACIGAGIEIPAFAQWVVATPDAWFQLPELSMGLIPGAGGTVSITRRIGRWRTAYMVLSGARISAPTALEWGLVDELVP